MTDLQLCIPQSLSPSQLELASHLAIAENPQNRPRPAEIAGIPSKFWLPGRTLRCFFMDGNPTVQAKVVETAQVWSESANVFLDFGNEPNSEIRISFAQAGSWSYVGTDALAIPVNQPTMNYGWLTEASTQTAINRVVLHEFGHALGMIHEHQHPEAGFEWDREAVLESYMAPPNSWSVSRTERNVLNRYGKSITKFTEFDEQSIMLYPIPNEHTIGDYEVDWKNSALSELDKAFVSRIYPRETQSFDAAVLAPNNKLYLFRGSEYARITPGQGLDPNYPKPIAGNWGDMPQEFASNLDAVMSYPDGNLYFFKNSHYIKFIPGVGIDGGVPQPILHKWPDFPL